MNIEVVLSPVHYASRAISQRHATVAVDILRATSAICAAFAAGVDEIVPLDTLEPLRSYAATGYLVAAERGGKKLAGASCGNSPTEYMSMDLKGRRLAYSTTNGTVSILLASDADRTLVGSFANISCLAASLVSEENVVLLCSGWKGEPSMEDTIFCGALIERLRQLGCSPTLVNDSAMMASDLWSLAAASPLDYCSRATHVHRLESFGDAAVADIRWAFQNDTCPLVPELVDGRLRIISR